MFIDLFRHVPFCFGGLHGLVVMEFNVNIMFRFDDIHHFHSYRII